MVPLVCTLTVTVNGVKDVYQIAPTAVGSDVGVTAQLVGCALNPDANVITVDVAAVIDQAPPRIDVSCDVNAKVPDVAGIVVVKNPV
jgi:hypothetical protein